jgi:hypothetical protein
VPQEHPEAPIIAARKKAMHAGMARAAIALGVAAAAGLLVMHLAKKTKRAQKNDRTGIP